MTRLVGLTGGIACGKSTVARFFTELGATVIDADALAREVVEPGSTVLQQIHNTFGDDVLNPQGRLDRAALARRVFADKAQRHRLEAITHPAIAELSRQRIDQALADEAPLVLYMAPLIYENKLDTWLPEIIVVDIDAATQRQRLLGRDGQQALPRINSQLPLNEKRARAHYLIDNRGDLENTRGQVERLYKMLLSPPNSPCR